MTDVESKACGKEVGEVQGWTTSSPTSLVVDCLASWVARGAALEMEAEGEERTWSIHSSKNSFISRNRIIKNYAVANQYTEHSVCVSAKVISKQSLFFLIGCHWRTSTMGKQLNYNLARMYSVALVMGKFYKCATLCCSPY